LNKNASGKPGVVHFQRFIALYIPKVRTLHPYPNQRGAL